MSNTLTMRFATAMASMELCKDSGMIDLTEDDFNFLTQPRLWTMLERSRVRRCVESVVYGSLDMVGLPRFGAPAEYIAGVIAYYVSPQNVLSACAVMDGAEFAENIVQGVDAPISASQLFSMVIQIKAGYDQRTEALYQAQQLNKALQTGEGSI